MFVQQLDLGFGGSHISLHLLYLFIQRTIFHHIVSIGILSMVCSNYFEPVVRRRYALPFVAVGEGVEFSLQTDSTYHAI
jgi:hypothetical protein